MQEALVIQRAYELAEKELAELDLNNLKLPYIVKDKVLMTPGMWNGFYYDAAQIQKSFQNTDWGNRDVRALFADHKDNSSDTWLGEVINPRLLGEKIIGDLAFMDEDMARKVAYGAHFGISPKLQGEEQPDKSLEDISYLNFSVVFNPACKNTYLNSQEVPKVTLILKQDEVQNKMGEKNLNFDTVESCMSAMAQVGLSSEQATAVCKMMMPQPAIPANAAGFPALNQEISTLKDNITQLSQSVQTLSDNMKKNDKAFLGRQTIGSEPDAEGIPATKELSQMSVQELADIKTKSPKEFKSKVKELMVQSPKEDRHRIYFNHLKNRRRNPGQGGDEE